MRLALNSVRTWKAWKGIGTLSEPGSCVEKDDASSSSKIQRIAEDVRRPRKCHAMAAVYSSGVIASVGVVLRVVGVTWNSVVVGGKELEMLCN